MDQTISCPACRESIPLLTVDSYLSIQCPSCGTRFNSSPSTSDKIRPLGPTPDTRISKDSPDIPEGRTSLDWWQDDQIPDLRLAAPIYGLHSLAAIGIATFLGGPLAGSILMGRNYAKLGRSGTGWFTFLIGIASTALLLTLI